MKKVLICIPMRNRADMVKEVLEYEAKIYKEYGIEIKYYDSSDNTDTLHVIDVIKEKYTLCSFT